VGIDSSTLDPSSYSHVPVNPQPLWPLKVRVAGAEQLFCCLMLVDFKLQMGLMDQLKAFKINLLLIKYGLKLNPGISQQDFIF